ncbi:MAG: DUF1836 domain-containing protein [Lachnospiraceae bacterium]|nr:DUF1836 domain-containing protein [Lachnospiraceae bacterium]
MKNKYTSEMLDLLRRIQNMDYIAPDVIPDIELYMDQVTTFMDEHLKSSKRFDEDKILTKTMINNYSKNDLLPPSKKKKYSKEHIILLIFIYYLKNFLSINDIKKILDPISENFFDKNGETDLTEIYQEIFKMQEENIDAQVRDVIRKLTRSNEAFKDISDEKEKNTLTDFAFISMLSFDIWVKKYIIESIIDHKLSPHTKAGRYSASSGKASAKTGRTSTGKVSAKNVSAPSKNTEPQK